MPIPSNKTKYPASEAWQIARPLAFALEQVCERVEIAGSLRRKNCRWASQADQNRNSRKNRWFIIEGKKRTLSELSRQTGIPVSTLHWRLAHGRSLDNAITKQPWHR